ncbi:MAG: response regulator transcription factor [Candidatus Eremiobacterota bacterium]
MKIKILLSDDHKLFRQGLRTLLEKQSDMTVTGEADNGISTIELSEKLLPDVILMDISMPDMNGIEATKRIISNNPAIKIIALSMHSDKRFITEMLKSGASGYLLKDSAFEELSIAIRTVMKNQNYLSSTITDIVIRDYINIKNKENSAFTLLSSREREVLQLLSEGKTTKEIALCLQVSSKTIETHRKQIMDKLNIYSMAELTKYAIREGITAL